MNEITDNIFNKDLELKNNLKILDFTFKKQFKLDCLRQKLVTALRKFDDTITISEAIVLIDENLVFEISEWMDLNTNITEILGEGEYFKKCARFFSMYDEYEDIKTNIKKK